MWFSPFLKSAPPILALLLMVGGCNYPKDMENSLDSIQDGILHVGVTENPPWVIRDNNQAHGLEPELIRELATQWNADIYWHWGTESELISALEQYQIHLAAGGFTHSSHLSKRAALTKPYFTSETRIGFPSEFIVPVDLTRVSVGIRRLQAVKDQLKSKDADPRFITRLHDQSFPVAAEDWRLEAYQLTAGPWVLASEKQVWALPKGENALMMEVQRYLNQVESIAARLVALERETHQ